MQRTLISQLIHIGGGDPGTGRGRADREGWGVQRTLISQLIHIGGGDPGTG